MSRLLLSEARPGSRRVVVAVLTFLSLLLGLLSPVHAATGDTDGDGLLDVWESQGYDANGDGVIDIDFPALGASPYRKDIFIEMDYMTGMLPSTAVFDQIVSALAALPVLNPDGTTGIAAHLDAGPAGGQAYNLGGGSEVPYVEEMNAFADVMTLRRDHQVQARQNMFHYMVWANALKGSRAAGVGLVGDHVFVSYLGPKYYSWVSDYNRAINFLHELGHNFNLLHGGADDVNYKPNYRSIMNYAYSGYGYQRVGGSDVPYYSTRKLLDLNENALDERLGLGRNAAGILAYGKRANGPLDFNQDGAISTTTVAKDLNGDGQLTILRSYNDLDLMRFPLKAPFRGNVMFRRGVDPSSTDTSTDMSTGQWVVDEELNPGRRRN
jgi:hypothetical protein